MQKYLNNFSYVVLQHTNTKKIQVAFFGYAWVLTILGIFTYFLTFLLALFKKDYKLLITLLLIYIVLSFLANQVINWSAIKSNSLEDAIAHQKQMFFNIRVFTLITYIIMFIVYGFFYNKLFLLNLFKKDYVVIHSHKLKQPIDTSKLSNDAFSNDEITFYIKRYFKQAIIRTVVGTVLIFVILLLFLYVTLKTI